MLGLSGISSRLPSSGQNMEAVRSFETLINIYQTTRRYILEDGHLQVTSVRTSNPTFRKYGEQRLSQNKKECGIQISCEAIILLTATFLGNGSVNTFPRQRIRMQR
jgi:hypothetical protein